MTSLAILESNTRAIDLIQQGHFQEASSILRTALHALLHNVRREEADHQATYMHLDAKVTATSLPIRCIPLQPSLSYAVDSQCQDHHAFSLFRHVLCMAAADHTALASMTGQNCLSVVVLYNMGLAYQLQGMQIIRLRTECFNKALKFFQMGATILESRESHVEMNGLLYLAISNNMGYVYSSLCEPKEVQQCLDLIQFILEAMQTFNPDVLLGDEYLLFRMNVLLLHGQEVTAAAAA